MEGAYAARPYMEFEQKGLGSISIGLR